MNPIEDHYVIFSEYELIVERIDGVLNLENLTKIKADQDADTEFNPAYNLLTDIRSTELCFPKKELEIYIDYLEKHPLTQSGRQFALLTATPMQVAIASLIQSKTRHLPQRMEIFSSLKAALSWLNVQEIEESKVKYVLEETLV